MKNDIVEYVISKDMTIRHLPGPKANVALCGVRAKSMRKVKMKATASQPPMCARCANKAVADHRKREDPRPVLAAPLYGEHMREPDWILGDTSTVHIDGAAEYVLRRYGEPGVIMTLTMMPESAEAFRAALKRMQHDIRTEAYGVGVADAYTAHDHDGGRTHPARQSPYRSEDH